MGGPGPDGHIERYPLHTYIVSSQEVVGSVLHPARYVRVGGTAVRRVVLEAAILGWVMRGRDHDAVREVPLAALVIYENGPRDNRRRRDAVVLLNDCIYVVGREDLQGGALGRIGHCV